MVRAEVYVLGAREPTAQGIAGLFSGAGSRKVALVVAHAGLVKLSDCGVRTAHARGRASASALAGRARMADLAVSGAGDAPGACRGRGRASSAGSELARARHLLGCTRLLTLTGPGGSGKTRLCIALAARVDGRRSRRRPLRAARRGQGSVVGAGVDRAEHRPAGRQGAVTARAHDQLLGGSQGPADPGQLRACPARWRVRPSCSARAAICGSS